MQERDLKTTVTPRSDCHVNQTTQSAVDIIVLHSDTEIRRPVRRREAHFPAWGAGIPGNRLY